MSKTDHAAVFKTDLSELQLKARGKVRDVYDLGETLLFIASDRLSAFDHVLPDPIPAKGKVLNQLSMFWFELTRDLIPNHVISTRVSDLPAAVQAHAAMLDGRSMMVRKLEMLPVECVARGYLAGSGWKEYREHGTVCGIELPSGLQESDKLPEPIFTPATKAEEGEHDENIPFSEAVRILGEDLAAEARARTLELYSVAADYARTRGIIIADTKFEFGRDGDQLILADEVLTPDSSRFWPADDYAPGRGQDSFDKQYVRDYLESIGWNKQPPVPALPEKIVHGTRDRYFEIFKILTGGELA